MEASTAFPWHPCSPVIGQWHAGSHALPAEQVAFRPLLSCRTQRSKLLRCESWTGMVLAYRVSTKSFYFRKAEATSVREELIVVRRVHLLSTMSSV
eukprot:2341366-Amphidinium_carterae.1